MIFKVNYSVKPQHFEDAACATASINNFYQSLVRKSMLIFIQQINQFGGKSANNFTNLMIGVIKIHLSFYLFSNQSYLVEA